VRTPAAIDGDIGTAIERTNIPKKKWRGRAIDLEMQEVARGNEPRRIAGRRLLQPASGCTEASKTAPS